LTIGVDCAIIKIVYGNAAPRSAVFPLNEVFDMTERLYDNGMLFTFDARVVSCTAVGKKYDVVPDRTAFFPEGGGQEGDV
jgi:alanyl-tRNA synthetase